MKTRETNTEIKKRKRENIIRVAFGTWRECATLLCLSSRSVSRDRDKREIDKCSFKKNEFLFYCIITYLCGGQHCVFIQAEDGVGHDGLVGQEAAAHHLRREKERERDYNYNSYTFPPKRNINS